MHVQAKESAIATTATVIATPQYASISIALYNSGNATVYLGGSDVSVAQGFPLFVGSSLTLSFPSTDTLYGIVESGSGTTRLLSTGGLLP